MRKFVLTILMLSVLIINLAGVVNKDKPARGTWNFQLEKVFQITGAGENILGRPGGILVSDEGWIYLYDKKNKVNFMFNSKGEYIKSFAPRGEGPGEIKYQGFIYFVDNMIVIPETTTVNYFSNRGEYLKTVKTRAELDTHLFINQQEYINAPLSIHNTAGKIAKIKKVNLVKQDQVVLAEFEVFKGGTGRAGGMVFDMIVPGLTPRIVIGHDKGRLYYGFSDTYTIFCSDLTGQKLGSFSLQREPEKLALKRKRQYFLTMKLPPQAVEQVIKTFPNQLTYFQKIDVHNQLIYVYRSALGNVRGAQEIDIFTPAGEYVYRANLSFGKDNYLFSPFGNLLIKGGFLYVVLEREDGEIVLTKYRINCPL